ncbi:hypothetical protein HGA91_06050 [candidate division WWE3 bacterium]|nr:hypothetical protein [candidate division WWE3 bacterium]
MEAQPPVISADSPLTLVQPKSPVRFRWVFILVFVFFIFAGLVAIPIGAAYFPQSFQFVPSTMRRTVNDMLLQTPLPKNTEQILIGMSQNKINLTKVIQDARMSAKVSTVGDTQLGVSNGTLQFSIAGPIDFSDLKAPKLQQSLSFTLASPDIGNVDLSGEFRIVDNSAYFRIETMPEQLMAFIGDQDFTKQWYSIPFEDYVFIDEAALLQNQTQSDLFYQKGLEFLSRPEILGLIEYRGVVEKDGKSAYHLVIDRSGPELTNASDGIFDLLYAIASESDTSMYAPSAAEIEQAKTSLNDSLKLIDRVTFELWTDSKDFTLLGYHTAVNTTVTDSEVIKVSQDFTSVDTQVALPQSVTIEFDVASSWSEWKADTAITAPSGSIPFQSVVEDSLAAQYDNVQDTQVKSDIAQIARALDMYYVDNGSYPTTLNKLVDSSQLGQIPSSPYGIDYIYLRSDNGQTALVVGILQASSEADHPLFVYLSDEGLTPASFSDFERWKTKYSLEETTRADSVLGTRTNKSENQLRFWQTIDQLLSKFK